MPAVDDEPIETIVIGSAVLSFCEKRASGFEKRIICIGASQVGAGSPARAASGSAITATRAASANGFVVRSSDSNGGKIVSPDHSLAANLVRRIHSNITLAGFQYFPPELNRKQRNQYNTDQNNTKGEMDVH